MGASNLVQQKDQAYRERNCLVRFLTSLYPSYMGKHVGDDWEDDWRNVVFIQTPAGQMSWHIHDTEVAAFAGLPTAEGAGVGWDGHTTEEKYARLEELGRHCKYYFGERK